MRKPRPVATDAGIRLTRNGQLDDRAGVHGGGDPGRTARQGISTSVDLRRLGGRNALCVAPKLHSPFPKSVDWPGTPGRGRVAFWSRPRGLNPLATIRTHNA